jgi:hypothetical protein
MASKAVVGARLLAALGVVAATVSAPVAPALAAGDVQVNPGVLQTTWYWHHVISDAPVVPPVAVPNEPSNVPDGDLPVASLDGQGARSKVSLVAFDISAAAPGSLVSAFTVTLTLDSAAQNVKTENPKLAAGLALRNWANGAGEADPVNAPPVEALVEGVWSADGTTISFAVPQVAQAWVDDTNFGLELVPAPAYTTPFQVSFLGGDKVKAAMTFSPAVPETPDTTVPDPGTGVVGGGTVPPPPVGGPVDTGSLGSPGLPGVSSGPPPAVDTGQGSTPPTTFVPAATALPEVSNRPSGGLFWAGVGLVALLVLMSLVLGGQPQSAASARASRLTTVLRQRRSTATSYSVPA